MHEDALRKDAVGPDEISADFLDRFPGSSVNHRALVAFIAVNAAALDAFGLIGRWRWSLDLQAKHHSMCLTLAAALAAFDFERTIPSLAGQVIIRAAQRDNALLLHQPAAGAA